MPRNRESRARYMKEYHARTRTAGLAYAKEYREANRAECQRRMRDWRTAPAGRAQVLLYQARQRRPDDLTITAGWIQERLERGVCEVSGLPFVFALGNGRTPFSPSLDRTDSALGYTPENTKVVCTIYNYAKNIFAAQDVVRLAEGICTQQTR